MKKFSICLLLSVLAICVYAQSPKYEFRATWFTTHYAIDWPKSQISTPGNATQIATQKKQMTDIFDQLQAGNLNAVCMQVRPTSDAYYKSSYEPWGQNLTGTRGKDPGYDPLEYAVEQAHNRGMELHAWVNPFRYEIVAGSYGANDPLRKAHPDWLLTYNNGTFAGTIIDPGIPEAREYVVNVLMEIVTNYDIDGILMDDYFYAYGGTTNEDAASVSKYKPASQSVADWRRENVNTVIRTLYDRIQKVKPWVKLGMGPGGIYSMDASAAGKYGLSLPKGIVGGDPYTTLYCDPLAWVSGGYIDYLAPQIYWATTTTFTDYDVLCQWWGETVETLCDRRTDGKRTHLYVSQASYKFGSAELGLEIDDNREFAPYDAPGSIFYNTSTYLNFEGEKICQNLSKTRFAHKALPPAITWKQTTSLVSVTNLSLSGNVLSWAHSSAERFSVYAFPKGMNHKKALASAEYLQGMSYSKNFTLTLANLNDYTFAVCAMDRYGNEYEATYLNDEAEKPTYIITAVADDGTMGSVTGGGEYMEGTTVTLTAIPNYGYEFEKWQDGNTENPRTVKVTKAETYTAYFELKSSGPIEEGKIERELLWQKSVSESGFLGNGVENRAITYYAGKLYVSDGVNYRYFIIDAQTGKLEKTVALPEQYFAYHNIRMTDDGALLFGNSAVASSSMSIYKDVPGVGKPSVLASLTVTDFGRSDYLYSAGSLSTSGYMLGLSNVNHKMVYIPFNNGVVGGAKVVSNGNLPIGTSAKAVPADAVSFFASVSGTPVTRHNLQTGEMIESWSGQMSPKTVSASGVGYFTLGGRDFLLTPADTYGSFETFEITNGFAKAERILETTKALGNATNSTFTIDFAINNDEKNVVYVYLLAPANGIAAYKYSMKMENTSVDVLPKQVEINATEDGVRIVVDGIKTISVYTTLGQKVIESVVSDELSVQLAAGTYIITIDEQSYKFIR